VGVIIEHMDRLWSFLMMFRAILGLQLCWKLRDRNFHGGTVFYFFDGLNAREANNFVGLFCLFDDCIILLSFVAFAKRMVLDQQPIHFDRCEGSVLWLQFWASLWDFVLLRLQVQTILLVFLFVSADASFLACSSEWRLDNRWLSYRSKVTFKPLIY
jgi:hypothetical protein